MLVQWHYVHCLLSTAHLMFSIKLLMKLMDSGAFLKSNQGKPLTFSHYDGKWEGRNSWYTYDVQQTWVIQLLFYYSIVFVVVIILTRINWLLMSSWCVSIEMYPTHPIISTTIVIKIIISLSVSWHVKRKVMK